MFDHIDENFNLNTINNPNKIENESKNKNACLPIKKPQINFSMKSTFNKFLRGPDYVTLSETQIHENKRNDLVDLVTGAKKKENKTIKAFTDYSTTTHKDRGIQLKVDMEHCNIESDIKENAFILKILRMKIAQFMVKDDIVLSCVIKEHSNFFDGYNGWYFKGFCDNYKIESEERTKMLNTILTYVHPYVFYEKNEFDEVEFAPIIKDNDLIKIFGIKLIDLIYKFNISQSVVDVIQQSTPKTTIIFSEVEKKFLEENRNYVF